MFIDNETKKTSNNGEDGGDIHIQSEGSDINSIIDRCTFQRHIGYLGIGISMDKYYGGAMTSIISDCKFESPVFHDGYNYQLTTAVRVGGHDSGTYSITRTNNLTCGVKKDYSAPNWARIVTVSSGNILDQDCPDSDSDSDGISDGDEIKNNTNPNCPQGKDCSLVSPALNSGMASTSANANLQVNASQADAAGLLAGESDVKALRQMLSDAGLDKNILDQISDEVLLNTYKDMIASSTKK